MAAVNVLWMSFRQRRLILELVQRDFKLRYLGSLLGSYWNFIHPLAMIAIYTMIFSQVMKAKLGSLSEVGGQFSYTFYLCSGVLAWNAFIDLVLRGTRVFQDNANFIKKIAFPLEILPSVVAGAASITFVISFGIFIVVLFALGHGVSWPIILVPLAFVLQTILGMGLAMIFSVFNVFFKDIEQSVNIIFQIWFWLTPIVYLAEYVPEAFRWGFYLNPFFYIVDIYQKTAFLQEWPDAASIMTATAISLLTFFLGASLMMRFKGDIPDEL